MPAFEAETTASELSLSSPGRLFASLCRFALVLHKWNLRLLPLKLLNVQEMSLIDKGSTNEADLLQSPP